MALLLLCVLLQHLDYGAKWVDLSRWSLHSVAPYHSLILSITLSIHRHLKSILPESNFITVAQKSGFATFKKVVITYVVLVLIYLILSVALDVRAIAVLPPLMFIILNVLVRLHVARTHLITRSGPFCEICAAVCCTCCSTAQSKFICSTGKGSTYCCTLMSA